MARKYIENPDTCSLVHAMNIIGNKWKPIIIYVLSNGALRFGMLNSLIPSISKKVLTNQLREMEHDGLLVREAFSEIPPRVEYSLTDDAKNLLPILEQLSRWTVASFPHITFEACKIDSTLP